VDISPACMSQAWLPFLPLVRGSIRPVRRGFRPNLESTRPDQRAHPIARIPKPIVGSLALYNTVTITHAGFGVLGLSLQHRDWAATLELKPRLCLVLLRGFALDLLKDTPVERKAVPCSSEALSIPLIVQRP
jgi:hypothetical protein